MAKPAKSPYRTKMIFFRARADEYEAIAKAASNANMLLSQWVRAVLLQKLGMEPKV